MDKTRIPENVLAFYDTISGRHYAGYGNIIKRMTDTTYLFYIAADNGIWQKPEETAK